MATSARRSSSVTPPLPGASGDAAAGLDGELHAVDLDAVRRARRAAARRGGSAIAGVGRPVSSTANSSPPSRATRSLGAGGRVCRRARDLLQHLVAGGVPEGVVDLFEVVEVDQQQREHAVRRCRREQLARRVRSSCAPVGQAGERVVRGGVRVARRRCGPARRRRWRCGSPCRARRRRSSACTSRTR